MPVSTVMFEGLRAKHVPTNSAPCSPAAIKKEARHDLVANNFVGYWNVSLHGNRGLPRFQGRKVSHDSPQTEAAKELWLLEN